MSLQEIIKQQRGSFEKYLEQVCFEANPMVLDDDMPDFFDDWLGSQNGEDYIRLADEYAQTLITQTVHATALAVTARIWDEFVKIAEPDECQFWHGDVNTNLDKVHDIIQSLKAEVSNKNV